MARQPLIRRATAPLHLQVALNEGILRRPVGGPAVLQRQRVRQGDGRPRRDRVHRAGQRVRRCFAEAKNETGLDHYQVRK